MDIIQTDHLKAYGIVHMIIKKEIDVEWLLNYRGGSFIVDSHEFIAKEATFRDVYIENITASELGQIYITIDGSFTIKFCFNNCFYLFF